MLLAHLNDRVLKKMPSTLKIVRSILPLEKYTSPAFPERFRNNKIFENHGRGSTIPSSVSCLWKHEYPWYWYGTIQNNSPQSIQHHLGDVVLVGACDGRGFFAAVWYLVGLLDGSNVGINDRLFVSIL